MPAEEIHDQPHPHKLAWRSLAHPFRKRTPFELKEAAFRIGLLILLVVFWKQFLLAAVIIAFAFVVYMVSTVEPEEVEHSIDNNGINSGGNIYIWEDLDYFYFSTIYGQDVVNVVTFGSHPLRITMLLGEANKQELRMLLEDYIPQKQAPEEKTLDKVVTRISRWFALD